MSVENLPRRLACISLVFAFTAGSSKAEGEGAWKDLGNAVLMQEQTQLRWTKSDNGQDVSWDDAKALCAKIGAGWRLPQVEELSKLYADAQLKGDSATCGNATCKAPPLFTLSGNWYWSETEVNKDPSSRGHILAWGVLLINGRQTQTFKFMPHGARALCVQAPAST